MVSAEVDGLTAVVSEAVGQRFAEGVDNLPMCSGRALCSVTTCTLMQFSPLCGWVGLDGGDGADPVGHGPLGHARIGY